MDSDYYIDLNSITLAEYENQLAHAELLPSRKLLKEDLQKRFACLKENGIQDLGGLMTVLKTSDKLKQFAVKIGLPEDYLVILKREIASLQPKPVNLIDFQGISKVTVTKLELLGIKNTLQLFSYIKSEDDRNQLSKKADIPYPEVLELAKLTDVSRIRWVGANFARLLVDSKCDTVEKVSNADYKEIYYELMKINEEKQYFKGKFGLNDMKLCVLDAKNVPIVIQELE